MAAVQARLRLPARPFLMPRRDRSSSCWAQQGRQQAHHQQAPAAVSWDVMSTAMDTATKLVKSSMARSNPSSAHNNEQVVALLQELVQHTKGVKAEIVAVKNEVKAVKSNQAKADTREINWCNQMARFHNSKLISRDEVVILPMDATGALPDDDQSWTVQELCSQSLNSSESWVSFYELDPGDESRYSEKGNNLAALFEHFAVPSCLWEYSIN